MGPKKGRPRKNIILDNPDGSGDKKDLPAIPKAPRGRPAKKKPILASESTSDATLPSSENVPIVRKTTRGRGRKRVQLARDVLCPSNNTEMQLRSQVNSGDLESIVVASKDNHLVQNPSVESASVDPGQDLPNCNIEDKSLTTVHPSVGDLSGENEDKANKENSFANEDRNTSLQKPDIKQSSNSHNLSLTESNSVTPVQDEIPVPPVPFSAGDVPLKKRRLRDLVVRDQEGFLIPTLVNSFTSPTSSASSTPQLDVPPDVNKRLIGAHVLFSGGFEQALYKAKSCNYQALGMFIKDLKTWVEPSEISDEDSDTFRKALKECGFCESSIIVKGSYIINICSSDSDILHASSECIIDDLKRCSQLGLTHYNIQLGEFGSLDTRETCIERVVETLNQIHKLTPSIITILENTCGEANTIGSCVDDFKDILNGLEDKCRIGFALDACHLYSCGIDIAKSNIFEALLQEFKDKLGLQYLKVVYVNDSRGDLNSRVDHHLNIGEGKIGLDFFEMLVNHQELHRVPMILETPISKHDNDFRTLNNLVH